MGTYLMCLVVATSCVALHVLEKPRHEFVPFVVRTRSCKPAAAASAGSRRRCRHMARHASMSALSIVGTAQCEGGPWIVELTQFGLVPAYT